MNIEKSLEEIGQMPEEQSDCICRAMRGADREELHAAAIAACEAARLKRDSVSRKLCGGSSAVDVGLLAACEQAFKQAEQAVQKIARHVPSVS